MINFRQTLCATFVVALGIGSATTSLFAQSLQPIKMNLPYAVTVGKVTLPAGECTVRSLNRDGSSTILLLQSASGVDAAVMAEPISESNVKSAGETKLTLRSVSGTYELDQIWMEGASQGYHILAPAPRQ
jgi:hypothetical protein